MGAVFGPGRPMAAYCAICEYDRARAARALDPWSDATHARLIAAKLERDQYYEYADAAAALARL